MSGPRQFRQIQGPHSHSLGEREYERLQEIILREKHVVCTVVVRPGVISIRTESPADFYMAKSAIKNQAGSREIIRSI